ncbi:hypothetical protein D3C85_1881420 [compost metagenome]
MYSEVNLPIKHSLLDLFHEEPFTTDFRQRHVEDTIPLGYDFLDFKFKRQRMKFAQFLQSLNYLSSLS